MIITNLHAHCITTINDVCIDSAIICLQEYNFLMVMCCTNGYYLASYRLSVVCFVLMKVVSWEVEDGVVARG